MKLLLFTVRLVSMDTCGQTTAGWQAKKEKIRCYNKRRKIGATKPSPNLLLGGGSVMHYAAHRSPSAKRARIWLQKSPGVSKWVCLEMGGHREWPFFQYLFIVKIWKMFMNPGDLGVPYFQTNPNQKQLDISMLVDLGQPLEPSPRDWNPRWLMSWGQVQTQWNK